MPDTDVAESQLNRLCQTCGAPCNGRFCAQCGQREFKGRHTLRRFVAGALQRTVGEEGALHTARQLTVRPGRVIRDYLAGRTIRYVHPATYLLLGVAFFALVLGVVGGPTGAGETERLFTLLVIPFVVVASRMVFWRGPFNFAEHLIVVLYLAGHVLVILAATYGVVLLVPRSFAGSAALAWFAIGAGYFVWGYSRIFEERPIRAAGAALAALSIGILVWLAFTLILVTLLRR